jgi:hypothetical protein
MCVGIIVRSQYSWKHVFHRGSSSS